VPGREVRLETLASLPLAVVRRQVRASELSRVVPECCGIVWNAMRSQPQARAGRHVALYWDNQVRAEIGVEVAGPFEPHGEILRSATPAGLTAWTSHLGPYGGLGDAHTAVVEWCRANGRTLTGVNWEIYGHWRPEWNSDPASIRTDVFYQVAP